MGNPLHYSVELPQRCLQLIDELWPIVANTRQKSAPELGSLTTTFLISMSMPIINLPIERIERHKSSNIERYADDRHINPAAAAEVTNTLGSQELSRAPFYIPGSWSFASCKAPHLFNVARSLPNDLADELARQEAVDRASNMQTSQWCSILRNAMAHGGIAYLDEDGRTSYGRPIQMYAFVSGKFEVGKSEPIALNVLRVSEANYRLFLRRWVDWLVESGISALAA